MDERTNQKKKTKTKINCKRIKNCAKLMTSLAVFGQEAVDNGAMVGCPRPVEFVICQMQTAQISAMPDGDLSERPAWPEMNACNEGQQNIRAAHKHKHPECSQHVGQCPSPTRKSGSFPGWSSSPGLSGPRQLMLMLMTDVTAEQCPTPPRPQK